MHAKYYVIMFMLCFFVWAVLVDNVILPDSSHLRQDVGAFTRYRVKQWSNGSRLDFIPDELLVYAVVDNREQLYYMEHQPHFEATLRSIPELMPLQLRYVHRFPKFWKRQLYEIRTAGRPLLAFSSYYRQQKQQEIWKTTGIMGGIYAVLVVLGIISKPRSR